MMACGPPCDGLPWGRIAAFSSAGDAVSGIRERLSALVIRRVVERGGCHCGKQFG